MSEPTRRGSREPAFLLAPGLFFLLIAFFFPTLQLLVQSFLTAGEEAGRLTLEHYAKAFSDDFYAGIAFRTFKLSIIITVICLLIGFPLAVAFAFLVFGAVGLGPGNPDLARAAILNAAMPAAGIYPILAQRYGEEARAALAMLVMTVLSFFTMSAVMLILGLGVPAA